MQVPLPFHLPAEATFENYIGCNNTPSVEILHEAIVHQHENLIYCWAEKSHGLTHLLQACCQKAKAITLSSGYFPMKELIQYSPDILQNLETLDLICFDDIDVIAGNKIWENAVFHCYNRAVENKKQLIFSAKQPPSALNISLPDLHSRLAHCLVLSFAEVEDISKKKIFHQVAEMRGIFIPLEVETYIFNHYSRELSDLLHLLDLLDKFSLVEKHRLTVPFVKRTITKIKTG
jgi:DnaA family protein